VAGTRVANRSRLDTLTPVDVAAPADLQNCGSTEFAAALAKIVPSLTFPRQSEVDGTDAIRPATLRGLSPGQRL
jgi:iron complex outermembrane receptor protein